MKQSLQAEDITKLTGTQKKLIKFKEAARRKTKIKKIKHSIHPHINMSQHQPTIHHNKFTRTLYDMCNTKKLTNKLNIPMLQSTQ